MAGSRQPIELLLHKGKKNLTKKEIEERKQQEVKAPDDNIEAPSYLTKKMKEEFDAIAEQLIDIGIMTNLDTDALARFVQSHHLYIKTSKKLRSIDPLSEEFGILIQHQDKFFKQCRSSSADLGLTISSRCKLVIPNKEEDKPPTKEEELFGDRL